MGEANQRGDFVQRRAAAVAKDRELDTLRRYAAMLACIVREQGRVRLNKRDLDALGSYALRVSRDGDVFMVTCEQPEAG